jgi:hypothetical protein
VQDLRFRANDLLADAKINRPLSWWRGLALYTVAFHTA